MITGELKNKIDALWDIFAAGGLVNPLEVIEQIGSYSRQIRSAIEDGVVEPHEKTAINDELYLSISKLQEHAALVYKIFCAPENSNARECAAPGPLACRISGETNA